MDTWLNYTPFSLSIKARNAFFDSIFYDVSSLTFDEWIRLNPLADRKGKLIVVSPSGSTKPVTIRHYASVEEFARSDDWNSVFAIAVTGVGSSVVGTAALARNIADACKDTIGGDVLGIVSGFGATDVIQESLGGFFFYGMLNQYRYLFESTLDNLSAAISQCFAKGTDLREQLRRAIGSPLGDYVPLGTDTHALHEILSLRYRHINKNIRLLVGHSKGNLIIADVLDHMSDEFQNLGDAEKGFRNLAVVTLGAVVDIAQDMIPASSQFQFLGYFDGLGRLNSRWSKEGLAPHTSLPARWHSLNRTLPLHTDVFEILQQQVKIPTPPQVETRGDGLDRVGLERTNRLEAALKQSARKAEVGLN